MKYLIFNIAVVAAIGYILYERGDLKGTLLEGLAEKAGSVVIEAGATKPMVIVAEEEPHSESETQSPVTKSKSAPPDRLPFRLEAEPAPELMSEPSPDPAKPGSSKPPLAIATEQGPMKIEVASIEEEGNPVVEPEEEAPAVAIAEPVAPEVAARRAVVLDSAVPNEPEPERPLMTASQRQENLRSLAEEMEILSIEMIYR